ncbi:hypothetical protein BGW37DRAFT_469403 [Umbelopsis sp. PMI_123]|nr:hypothetical protein BGW37DRAFT_469403 [Umbelopsis sp. PMI_123]
MKTLMQSSPGSSFPVAAARTSKRNANRLDTLRVISLSMHYSGYKNERVVHQRDNGDRIVMIGSGSSRHEFRKLHQILEVVNAEMSAPEVALEHLLCCKSLFVQPIAFAHRVTDQHGQHTGSAVFCRTTTPANRYSLEKHVHPEGINYLFAPMRPLSSKWRADVWMRHEGQTMAHG